MSRTTSMRCYLSAVALAAVALCFVPGARADTPTCTQVFNDPTIATCTCICDVGSPFPGCFNAATDVTVPTPNQCPDMLLGRRVIAGGERGVCTQDLLDSIKQEYKEHEDLPNTTNPDDWAKISGKKGERIVFIRTLVSEDEEPDVAGGRAIERVQTGQYL